MVICTLSHELKVIIDEPRSFLHRTDQQFDLIILPLTDTFRPVTAGAYTLNEDYRYTVEAFADALVHLSPNGMLVVERWLQLPPSESLRLWGTVVTALRLLDDRRQETEDRQAIAPAAASVGFTQPTDLIDRSCSVAFVPRMIFPRCADSLPSANLT